MFQDVKEEQVLQLALKKGLVSPLHLEELQRKVERMSADTQDSGNEWHLISCLVRSGELSLDQLEALTRELVESRLDHLPKGGEENKVLRKAGASLDQGERFRTERFLGAGGMGEVHLAYDTKLKRYVALKRLKMENMELHPRFLREAQLQARIEHENICRIYDIGEFQGRWFIAMQYIEGQTLKQMAGKLALEEKVKLVQEVAEALHAAHRLGLIHRDIKPVNIMVEVGEDGKLKPYVTDFGLVRDVNREGITLTETLVGSPHYMSPEQASGDTQNIDRRSDIYSLGVTFYELLTGELPFPGTAASAMMHILQTDAKPVRKLNPAIPLDLETITMKCLEKEPIRRYSSARELADDLGRYLNDEPILARRYSVRQRWVKRIKKHKALAAILGMSFILLILMGGMWLQARRKGRFQAEIASQFGREVEAMESVMRYAHLVKPHDIRRDLDKVRTKMEEIRRKTKDLGKAAEGPGNYALGQGYLAMRDYPLARKYLESAWRSGFQTPEVAYALGITLGELYRVELQKAEKIADRELQEEMRKRLQAQFMKPALQMLNQAKSTPGIPAGYVEALIAFYNKKYDAALQNIKDLKNADDRFYEIKVLEANIYMARGDDYQQDLHRAESMNQYEKAVRAYGEALDTGRSDADTFVRLGQINDKMAAAQVGTKGENIKQLLDNALGYCDQALRINPELAEAYTIKCAILNTRGFYLSDLGLDPTSSFNQALDMIKAALSLNPHDDYSYYLFGQNYGLRGYYETISGRNPLDMMHSAADYFQKALAINPNSVWANLDLVQVLFSIVSYKFSHGQNTDIDIDLLLKSSSVMVQQFPDLDRSHLVLGDAYLFKFMVNPNKNYDSGYFLEQAVDGYKQAIALNHKITRYYINCINAYLLKAEFEMEFGKDPDDLLSEASQLLQKALEITPNNPDLYICHCYIYWELARYQFLHGMDPYSLLQKVESCLQKAKEMGATYTYITDVVLILKEIETQRACLLNQSPEPFLRVARKAFKERIKAEGDNFELFNKYAEIVYLNCKFQMENGRLNPEMLSEARNLVLKALAIKSDNCDTQRLMGKLAILQARDLMAKKKNPESALAEAQVRIDAALGLNQYSADSYLTQAALLLCKYKWLSANNKSDISLIDKGIATIDKALSLNPDFAEAYIVKGVWLQMEAFGYSDKEKKAYKLNSAQKAFAKGYAITPLLKKKKNSYLSFLFE